MLRKRRLIGTIVKFAGLGVVGFTLFVGVSSLSAEGASSIAQGFQTTESNIVSGALVSLKQGTPNTVELSTSDTSGELMGVAGEKSLIELSNDTVSVRVVTSGVAAALVSDINGPIKTGDKITASPIAGIGMKATQSVMIVGTAQADLSADKAETRTVTDKQGRKQTVHIGAIPLQVDKVFYEAAEDRYSFLPNALDDFARSIVGRQVSPIRVLVATLLVVILFVAVTVLLYSAVRSSIISIGRNPLSEQAVRKGLLEVSLTVIGVLVFTLIVIYLVLTT